MPRAAAVVDSTTTNATAAAAFLNALNYDTVNLGRQTGINPGEIWEYAWGTPGRWYNVTGYTGWWSGCALNKMCYMVYTARGPYGCYYFQAGIYQVMIAPGTDWRIDRSENSPDPGPGGGTVISQCYGAASSEPILIDMRISATMLSYYLANNGSGCGSITDTLVVPAGPYTGPNMCNETVSGGVIDPDP
jgi:hypothetical protein